MTTKTPEQNFDYKCQIITIGDSTVGKTSLLFQYMEQKNPMRQVATVGIDYFTKDEKIKGKVIRTKVWDTAGQERYRCITDNFFKSANGVILVYDVSSRDTFDNLKIWVQSINLKAPDRHVKKILIGNKIDLERQVNFEEGKAFAESQGLTYFEASAKENLNVSESIRFLINEIFESGQLVEQHVNSSVDSIKLETKSKKIKNNKDCC